MASKVFNEVVRIENLDDDGIVISDFVNECVWNHEQLKDLIAGLKLFVAYEEDNAAFETQQEPPGEPDL